MLPLKPALCLCVDVVVLSVRILSARIKYSVAAVIQSEPRPSGPGSRSHLTLLQQ
jgi:hypothetical protein